MKNRLQLAATLQVHSKSTAILHSLDFLAGSLYEFEHEIHNTSNKWEFGLEDVRGFMPKIILIRCTLSLLATFLRIIAYVLPLCHHS
jgi:hypothetical protein